MDLKDYVKYALTQEVEIQPLVGLFKEGLLVADTARKNFKRPARMDVFVPDEWIPNFRGNPKLADSFVVVRIPRETFEAYKKEYDAGSENTKPVSEAREPSEISEIPSGIETQTET